MKKFTLVAALSASTLAISAGASFADYTLNILHINDWHSRIESNNAFESTCSAEEETAGECIGGAARLKTAIDMRRAALEGQNTVLLNGGDNFQGSLFYATYKGAVEAEFLNLMEFDAMTVGNHEFDDGEPVLATFLDAIKVPVLSANVKASAASLVGDRIKPSITLDIGGEKIGIVGAVTTDTPEVASPGPNITIEDDVATITAEVERLTAEGVDKIIALTHVGYPRDMEMIARIPNVDVVVGGHSHTLLHNDNDKAAGPYPTMIDNPGGYKVPVVQAESYSKYLGELAVVFDDAGVVKKATGDPLFLDKAIIPDPTVLARVAELGGPIEALKNQEVAETTAPIDGARETCRAQECAMGNLIADAMIDRVKDQGVTIAIQNGGGIRASIDEGVVTMGEVLTVLPFQNTLATFQLTGADLKASIEAGLSEIEEGKGKFPQVAGLKYSFDKSVAPNEGRLKSLEVMEGGAWVPIDETKTYTIATNNFVRAGGDGYTLFAENAQNAYDYGPSLEQVVADYMAANQPYTPALDSRITDLTAAAATTAAPSATATAPATTETAPAATTTPPADAAAAPATATPAAEQPAAATETAQDMATPPADTADSPAAQTELPELPAASSEIANQPPAMDAAPADGAAATDTAAAPAIATATTAPATDAAPAPVATTAVPATGVTAADDEADPIEATPVPAEETAMAAPAAAAGMAAAPDTHVVVAGDSYWKLAERFYGDGRQFTRLRDTNPEVEGDNLQVGVTLKVPPAN